MSDLKITVNGKPIGEAMNERVEKTFYEQVFKVEKSITESTDDFILTTIAGNEVNERRLPKERVRRAFDLLFAEDEGRITERKVGKWITKSKRNPLCLAGKFFWRECSACGWCREDDSTANDTPFCPMCGAKMEEGD